jgi:hypothetical protein
MKPDHYFYVCDPELVGAENANPTLRFQTTEEREGRYRRSGKYIHLEMTSAFAMQLLGHLKAYQQALGLPEPPAPTRIDIPPAKDRN